MLFIHTLRTKSDVQSTTHTVKHLNFQVGENFRAKVVMNKNVCCVQRPQEITSTLGKSLLYLAYKASQYFVIDSKGVKCLGMTQTGDHGGETIEEIDSALFAFSPSRKFSNPDKIKSPICDAGLVHQVSFLRLISLQCLLLTIVAVFYLSGISIKCSRAAKYEMMHCTKEAKLYKNVLYFILRL